MPRRTTPQNTKKSDSAESAENLSQNQKPQTSAPDDSTKITNRQSLYAAVFSWLQKEGADLEKARDQAICEYLQFLAEEHNISKDYNILILHDEGQMVKSDADDIYDAVTNFKDKKPLLLILYSSGGSADSAYLIGKLCRDYCNNNFIVVVPRQAKSAATLLCCAADEIHMGSLSELGPIDPQIDDLPALGLKNAVEHIAELVKQNPASSGMFASYLSKSLKLIHLGYYERVAESAKQYAERLLRLHNTNLNLDPEKIANDLVYGYKDHGFVIDKGEAATIIGNDVVKIETPEYRFGSAIYQTLGMINRLSKLGNYYFYFIGSLSSKGKFRKRANVA